MLEMGRDFWCAYRGAWVAKSEFNDDKPHYHQPTSKSEPPYMASPWGKCKCVECNVKEKINCAGCDQPEVLKAEQLERINRIIDAGGNVIGHTVDTFSRCVRCMLQYSVRGVLR